eukprot:115139-Prorocentrum_minimum.AAC.1
MDPESAASIAYAELHPDKRKGQQSAARSTKPSALDAMQTIKQKRLLGMTMHKSAVLNALIVWDHNNQLLASQKTVLGGHKEGNKGSHSTGRARSAHSKGSGSVKSPIRAKTLTRSAPASPVAGLGGSGFHVQVAKHGPPTVLTELFASPTLQVALLLPFFLCFGENDQQYTIETLFAGDAQIQTGN